MDLGLAGRRAIVTGGSKGIGKAIAAELVAEGAAVAICSRHADELAAAAEELTDEMEVVEVIVTLAPSCASSSAHAKPIPASLPAPVTSADLSSRRSGPGVFTGTDDAGRAGRIGSRALVGDAEKASSELGGLHHLRGDGRR